MNRAFFFIAMTLLAFSEYAYAQKDYIFEIIFFTPSEVQQPYEELPSIEPIPALAEGIDLEALRALLLKRSEQQVFKDISELEDDSNPPEFMPADSLDVTHTEPLPIDSDSNVSEQQLATNNSDTSGLIREPKQSLTITAMKAPVQASRAEISSAVVASLPYDLDDTFNVALPKLEAAAAFTQWLPLGHNDYQLKDLLAELEKNKAYRVLHHMAWRQPASNASNSKSIAVQAGFDYQHNVSRSDEVRPELISEASSETQKSNHSKVLSIALEAVQVIDFEDEEHSGLLRKSFAQLAALATLNTNPDVIHELEGSLRVEVGRYLHLYTDLVFRVEQVEDNNAQKALYYMPARDDFRIQNHHRMRSRQVYYIDHPMLGMLVQATPLNAPKPEQTTLELVN